MFDSDTKFYLTPRKLRGYATVWNVRGSNRGRGRKLSFPKQTGCGARQHVLRIRSWGYSSRGVMLNHSPPFIAEVQNEWSHTYTPPIR